MFGKAIWILLGGKKKPHKTDINEYKSEDAVTHVSQPKKQSEDKKTLLADSTNNVAPIRVKITSKEKGDPIEDEKENAEKIKVVEPIKEPIQESKQIQIEKSFSNNHTDRIFQGGNTNWFIVSASAIGSSHIKSHVPCQDNHYCESISEKWGIAISCDGAGSAENSHLGSKHVASEIGIKYFKEVIIKKGWHESDTLPNEEEWRDVAREGCVQIYKSLENLAHTKKIRISSLACTLIVVIYSPVGLLVTHIGDGRAGYCNEQGEWKPAIIPHKGEEANQTIFITSDRWMTSQDFRMSGIEVPESRVILEKPTAFTLMSDGCELHSFECSVMDQETNKWHDPNRPYPNFFNPLVKNLQSMHNSNTPIEITDSKWRKFIEAGSAGLEAEPDDKTMILGILI